MRKYKLWVWIVILMLLILSGCNKPAGNEVSLGQEFTLSVGQSVMVAGENLSIKFIDVTSDSRCPKGATCIWEGEVSALIEITSSGSTYRKVLTQPGSSSSTKTSFTNYEIMFDIQPYPELNKEIDRKDYRLELVIN
jgi:hypothetical protein